MIDPDLEYQYNAREAVPEHMEYFERWGRLSGEMRRNADCRLDLAYGTGERETLDLFPAGTAERVLLFLHGGYWQAMDKSFFSFLAGGVLPHGITLAVANYPLCPAVGIPRIQQSVHRACRWIEEERKHTGWERLQLCGHSAGGQLAAMLLADTGEAAGESPAVDFIDGAVSISGLYDLAPLIPTSINIKLGLDPATAAACSPLGRPLRSSAPALLCVGERERPAFHQQLDEYARWRDTQGLITRQLVLPGLHHFSAVEELAKPESDLVQALVAL